MNLSKNKLYTTKYHKSTSLLNLDEMEALEKSSDWRKKYTIRSKEIGRGHFSKVYQVSCVNHGSCFAAKVIRRRKYGVDTLEKIKQEAVLIRQLNSAEVQSVIRLFDIHESFKEVVLILEMAKGGSLFKLVEDSNGGLLLNYVKVVTYKLLLALEAMHNRHIVHLDIKADNVLLREPYPSTDIVLCDFGLATQLKIGHCHKELVGTPDYMAPEIINYENVTVNTDMWSVGVLVYYLLTGHSPFMGKSKDETLINVSKVKISFDEIFSQSEYSIAKDFILALCNKSPELRLTSTVSQTHKWFANIDDFDLDVSKPVMEVISPVEVPESIFRSKISSSCENIYINPKFDDSTRLMYVDEGNVEDEPNPLPTDLLVRCVSDGIVVDVAECDHQVDSDFINRTTEETPAGLIPGMMNSIPDLLQNHITSLKKSCDCNNVYNNEVATTLRDGEYLEINSDTTMTEHSYTSTRIELSSQHGLLVEILADETAYFDPWESYLNISTYNNSCAECCSSMDTVRKERFEKDEARTYSGTDKSWFPYKWASNCHIV